jgi:hypothetical protein
VCLKSRILASRAVEKVNGRGDGSFWILIRSSLKSVLLEELPRVSVRRAWTSSISKREFVKVCKIVCIDKEIVYVSIFSIAHFSTLANHGKGCAICCAQSTDPHYDADFTLHQTGGSSLLNLGYHTSKAMLLVWASIKRHLFCPKPEAQHELFGPGLLLFLGKIQ